MKFATLKKAMQIPSAQRALIAAVHIAAMAAALGLTACSSAFSPAAGIGAGLKSSGDGAGTGGGSSGGSGVDPVFEAINLKGTIDSPVFGKAQVVNFDKETKELMLSLPMPTNIYIDSLTLDLPLDARLPGARVTLEHPALGSSTLVLRLPLQYLLKGVNFIPGSKLPNGDPIPNVPDGELPAIGLELTKAIKNIKATIYLGVNVIGIYVNTPFDPLFSIEVPVMSEDGTRTWGYVSTIPAKNGLDGGFFTSFALPNELAILLDNYL